RVNEVHVFLEEDEEDGFYIEETISGSRVSEIIEFIQYKESDLARAMKRKIDRATKNDLVKPREGTRLLDFYTELLSGKTYLNIGPESKSLRQFRRKTRQPKKK